MIHHIPQPFTFIFTIYLISDYSFFAKYLLHLITLSSTDCIPLVQQHSFKSSKVLFCCWAQTNQMVRGWIIFFTRICYFSAVQKHLVFSNVHLLEKRVFFIFTKHFPSLWQCSSHSSVPVFSSKYFSFSLEIICCFHQFLLTVSVLGPGSLLVG